MKSMMMILLIMILSSCTLLETGVKYFSDNIEITWKKDKKDSVNVVVDSIVVKFNPVYWEEMRCDTALTNDLKDYKDAGYSIWIRKIDNIKLNEIRKLDTVIYLYKKAE